MSAHTQAEKDRAVVEAVEALLTKRGHITRSSVEQALAAEPAPTPDATNDPVATHVEETV